MVAGVPITLPFKPYPSQLAVMSHVVQAISNSNHALLESPTGSGKTIALLASALATLYQLSKSDHEPPEVSLPTNETNELSEMRHDTLFTNPSKDDDEDFQPIPIFRLKRRIQAHPR